MKVKIGDKIYNSEEEPIMIILDSDDKKLISEMHPKDFKSCSFPENFTSNQAFEFMKTKK